MEEPKSSATTATDSSFSAQTVEACEAHKWSALLITGYVIDQFGFTPAFYLAASTYLAGMLLLWFVKE